MQTLTKDVSRLNHKEKLARKLASDTVNDMDIEELEQIAYEKIFQDIMDSKDEDIISIAKLIGLDLTRFIQKDH